MAIRENRDSRDDELAYNLGDDDLTVYLGKGLGNIYYEDAIELSMIRRSVKGLRADQDFVSQFVPRPEESERSRKSPQAPRASKNNPYICDYCGYRTTRYDNMIKHLVKVHDDWSTDPRAKSKAIREGLVETLRRWKGL